MSKQNPYLNEDFLLTSVCLEADLASQFFAHPVVSSAFFLFPPFLPGFKILPYSSFLLWEIVKLGIVIVFQQIEQSSQEAREQAQEMISKFIPARRSCVAL